MKQDLAQGFTSLLIKPQATGVCSYSRSSIRLSCLGTCGEEVQATELNALELFALKVGCYLFRPLLSIPCRGGGKKRETCAGGNILTAGVRRNSPWKDF